jgi:hypothetical protein
MTVAGTLAVSTDRSIIRQSSRFMILSRDINLNWDYDISIRFTGQGGLHIFTGCYEYFMCSSNESGVNRGTGVVSKILTSPAYIELAAEFFY